MCSEERSDRRGDIRGSWWLGWFSLSGCWASPSFLGCPGADRQMTLRGGNDRFLPEVSTRDVVRERSGLGIVSSVGRTASEV